MLEGNLPLGHPGIESFNFMRLYDPRYAEAMTLSTNWLNEASAFSLDHQPSASTPSLVPNSVQTSMLQWHYKFVQTSLDKLIKNGNDTTI